MKNQESVKEWLARKKKEDRPLLISYILIFIMLEIVIVGFGIHKAISGQITKDFLFGTIACFSGGLLGIFACYIEVRD